MQTNLLIFFVLVFVVISSAANAINITIATINKPEDDVTSLKTFNLSNSDSFDIIFTPLLHSFYSASTFSSSAIYIVCVVSSLLVQVTSVNVVLS